MLLRNSWRGVEGTQVPFPLPLSSPVSATECSRVSAQMPSSRTSHLLPPHLIRSAGPSGRLLILPLELPSPPRQLLGPLPRPRAPRQPRAAAVHHKTREGSRFQQMAVGGHYLLRLRGRWREGLRRRWLQCSAVHGVRAEWRDSAATTATAAACARAAKAATAAATSAAAAKATTDSTAAAPGSTAAATAAASGRVDETAVLGVRILGAEAVVRRAGTVAATDRGSRLCAESSATPGVALAARRQGGLAVGSRQVHNTGRRRP